MTLPALLKFQQANIGPPRTRHWKGELVYIRWQLADSPNPEKDGGRGKEVALLQLGERGQILT